ncbi:response regulator [Nitrosococcus watsonii]|uniref:Response regulator receiver protein n=1 Tax=Nitrosococcus watsoni (strain C-113) TaxID=105559 RepID=D8KBM8_NITWC|nr:response regulator [Nitrosococcus watsonii]ADJ27639.1 response regulator receiver protein [Nitrosococcus watsonii C-113]
MKGEILNILLVEDNPDHAELVMRSFQAHRVANCIHHVIHGEEALQYLFRQDIYSDPRASPRPHVILLDLRLPRIDGLEILEIIRSSPEIKNIPVVVLTTSKAEQDVAKAYSKHINSYLVKPVDFEGFNRMMEDLGFYWLAWNHYPWSE